MDTDKGRLKERLEVAGRALESLERVLREEKTEIVRDAAIQRFEYTFEAVWKAAQFYLKVMEGKDISSPKGVIRSSFQSGVLSDEQARVALGMVDDRNLTVHTYNEELAELIYERLAGYAKLMGDWVKGLNKPQMDADENG